MVVFSEMRYLYKFAVAVEIELLVVPSFPLTGEGRGESGRSDKNYFRMLFPGLEDTLFIGNDYC
jgi:hypothetical protein